MELYPKQQQQQNNNKNKKEKKKSHVPALSKDGEWVYCNVYSIHGLL